MTARPSVLLVCLGNICRSPLAEAALRAEAARAGLDLVIDSAARAAGTRAMRRIGARRRWRCVTASTSPAIARGR